MDVNSTLSEAVAAEAALSLAPAFTEILASCAGDSEEGELQCLAAGHRVLAKALSLALERLDAALCAGLPEGTRIHDRRRRTLSTTVGDVSFRYTRCRDGHGGTVVPLADELDCPWGARISPAARAFLLDAGAEVDRNIDPFHVNRKVTSCFGPDARELSANILGMVIDGYALEAADCIEMAGAMGLANRGWPEAADYLRNSAEFIYRPGAASLGTMEAEQQHVCGARMDSVPCGWSVRGAGAMARVRSRRASQRELPRLTRGLSATPRRRERAGRLAAEAERRAAAAVPTASRVPLSAGRGREVEHAASLVGAPANVRYAAGVDRGMAATGW